MLFRSLSGKALYQRIAATPLFSEGIQRLLKGAANYKISLMCAEKDPITCHRTILVCHKLKDLSLQINHILSDGTLEAHQDLEARLLSKFNQSPKNNQPIQLNLFKSEPQVKDEIVDLETAYYRHGLARAYVSK